MNNRSSRKLSRELLMNDFFYFKKIFHICFARLLLVWNLAYVIQWSLCGFYVCVTTTSLITVDMYIAEIAAQIVHTKLLLQVGSTVLNLWALTLTIFNSKNWTCRTVLWSTFNMHLWQVSLAGDSGSLIGCPWPLVGLLFGCRWQLGWVHILGPFSPPLLGGTLILVAKFNKSWRIHYWLSYFKDSGEAWVHTCPIGKSGATLLLMLGLT